MHKYCAHYISTLSRCRPPSDHLSSNKPSAQCLPRAQGMAGNALHPSRLHQSPMINCANCAIFLNLLVLLAGDTQPFLKEAERREQAVVRKQSAGGPACMHGTLRPPRVAQWTRLTGKLPKSGWWSDTQHLTLGSLHNKDIGSLFSFTSLWGISNC